LEDVALETTEQSPSLPSSGDDQQGRDKCSSTSQLDSHSTYICKSMIVEGNSADYPLVGIGIAAGIHLLLNYIDKINSPEC
jgi:hypothetical protein